MKFIAKAFGVILLSLALFMFVSVMSYHASDPTLMNYNDLPILNILGTYGANAADILIQSFGYVILYPILFLSILGYKLIVRHSTYFFFITIKISLFFLALPTVCALANFISEMLNCDQQQWGGFVGRFFCHLLLIEFAQFHNAKLLLISIMTIGFICAVFSLDLSYTEWKNSLKVLYKAIMKVLSTLMYVTRYCYYSFKNNLLKILKKALHLGHEDPEKHKLYQNVEHREKSVKSKGIQKKDVVSDVTQSVQKLVLSSAYELPSVSILREIAHDGKQILNKEVLKNNGHLLSEILQDFGITATLIDYYSGPVVTLYEFEPAAGTKSSRVIGLADDIARSMKALSARISVIPGKNAMGIELPNAKRATVYLRELLESNMYKESTAILPLILGKNIAGVPVIADLAKMPHLLVAGTTGSGKSVAINTMILSLLYRYTPEVCKFVMIDPKMLELSVYDGIPHLLSPVVTEPKKAVIALKWVVKEMEERYKAMSTLGMRNIIGYNAAITEAINANKTLTKIVQTGFDKNSGKPIFEKIALENKHLPYIVVIVDEMADLMLVAGKDIELYIQRLAQMARAAGIHIIMATQRPSVDVITGVIKANFPTRISFHVTSKIDSRTVLGEQGAEQLLGMGDMLYMMTGGKIERIHGPFVEDKDVENVVNFWKEQGSPEYIENMTTDDEASQSKESNNLMSETIYDELYKQAVEIILRDRKISTSYIQRCLKIGYNKAATIVEQMEKEGIVTAPNHTGKREIID